MHRLIRECCDILVEHIHSLENQYPDRWVPSAQLKRDLHLEFEAAPKSSGQLGRKPWLFATFARMLEDELRVERKELEGAAYYRTMADYRSSEVRRASSQRVWCIDRAREGTVADAAYWMTKFNQSGQSNTLGSSITWEDVAPNSSEEERAEALKKLSRLYSYDTSAIGETLFKNPRFQMSHEQAVQEFKAANPGFTDQVYGQVISSACYSSMR